MQTLQTSKASKNVFELIYEAHRRWIEADWRLADDFGMPDAPTSPGPVGGSAYYHQAVIRSDSPAPGQSAYRPRY